jgi:peptidoglycan hydrolase CwlO-like protein
MPAKLSDNIKSLVIQQWLQGMPRNDIATENGLSSGAVANIVNKCRRRLGFADADEFRDLAVTMKKVGVSAAQCALGFRIATIMLKIGVNEDSFENFILDVYNRCKDIGLSPQRISSYLEDLIEFSRDVLPISKIQDYIKQKTDEERKLQEEIEKLSEKISALRQEKMKHESLRDQALQEKQMTISQLEWYSDLKSELTKYSISVDDVSELVRLVNNIRTHTNYDVQKVINEYWSIEMLRTSHDALQKTVQSMRNEIDGLEQQRSYLEGRVKMYNKTISTYEDLKAMGFGLNELSFLLDTINEIAAENDIPVEKAVSKFLSDVEQQYHKKVGFEYKLRNMREELDNMGKEHVKLRSQLLSNPLIGPKLLKLIQSGLTEQDIINVANLIEKYATLYGARVDSNTDKKSIVSDLNKYGGLSSAIEGLSKKVDMLRKDLAFLENQKQDLEGDNQRMLSSSNRLRYIVSFLEGTAFSLRYEIINLVFICMYIIYLLEYQFHNAQNLQSHQLNDEFAALSRYNKGEKDVPIKEIKDAVMKAIQVLLNRIGPDDDSMLAANLLVTYQQLSE